MKRVYASTDVPIYLDATAARLLAEGRSNFLRYGLDYAPIVSSGQDTMLFGWTGDRIMSTLAIGLTSIGADVSHDGICLTLPATDPHTVRALLDALVEQGPPDPVELAATVPTKVVEKHDELLSDELLDMAFASRSLDVTGAWDLAGRLAIKGRDASPR
jgi:ATP-dependent Lhr-like helicase